MARVPLETSLTPDDVVLLRTLGLAARAADTELWLVGGSVRDALLGRPVSDLDLTSQMPADELGPLLAASAGGRIGSRSHFGTLKLHLPGRTLDLATARDERYAHPGTLPAVSRSDMRADLARRDFSVNAMAASLAPESFATLIDNEGGVADLHARSIRALNATSFRDDATRILRAVRYVVRLRFHIEPATARWLRRDRSFLDTISPARVHRELDRMLSEPKAPRLLANAWRRGVLAAVHSALGTTAVGDALRRAARSPVRANRRPPSGLELLAVLVYAVPGEQVTALEKRLGLTSRQAAVARHAVAIRAAEPGLAGAQPSAVLDLTGGAPREAVAGASVASDNRAVRSALAHFLRRSAGTVMPLDGLAIQGLGVPQGPEVGRTLASLRGAILDGRVRSRSSAVSHVRRLIAADR